MVIAAGLDHGDAERLVPRTACKRLIRAASTVLTLRMPKANLVALLDVGVRRGDLINLNPHTAAEELFGLWQGFTNFQFSLGVDIDAIGRDLDQRVRRGC